MQGKGLEKNFEYEYMKNQGSPDQNREKREIPGPILSVSIKTGNQTYHYLTRLVSDFEILKWRTKV